MNNRIELPGALSKCLYCILIFACCPIGIVLPIYLLDVNYAVSTVFLFWVPVVVMFIGNRAWLIRRNLLLPLLSAATVLAVVAVYFEYAALGIGVWNFSEEHHLLLRTIFKNPGFPFAIYGAPVEEFMFWFGATPFCILLYCSFWRLIKPEESITYELLLTAAWPVMLIPFVPVIGWLHSRLRGKKIICIPALVLTAVFFLVTMTCIEYNALLKGHWVYNLRRITGWKFLGVIPTEELLYYLLGPVFVVQLFHFFALRPAVILRGTNKTNDIPMVLSDTVRKIRRTVNFLHLSGANVTAERYRHRKENVFSTATDTEEWNDTISVEKLELALSQCRFFDAHSLVNKLQYELEKSKRVPDTTTALSVLNLLHKYAWFTPLFDVADAIRRTGNGTPKVRRLLAQALIEQNRLTEAICELVSLHDDLETSRASTGDPDGYLQNEKTEVIGLLGRSYKQLYINAHPRSVEPRMQDLERAIEYYGNAYHQRLGDFHWYGVNYIALHTHAVRMQQDCPTAYSTEARREAIVILDEIEQRAATGTLLSWDWANRTECYLALGDYEKAIGAVREYLHQPGVDAFQVQSTRRQLMELWELNESASPGREILPMMMAGFLERGGGYEKVVLLPEKYEDYANVLEVTQYLSIRYLLNALSSARAVARIGPDRHTVWGTGFLINPEWLGCTGESRYFFLTCAHICSSCEETRKFLPFIAAPETYRVHFSDFTGTANRGVPVRVLREIWTSPPSVLDATLLEIDAPPAGVQPVSSMASPSLHALSAGRVSIVGHPKGSDLHVSMQNNELLDIRDQFIQYNAPTDSGSSGSPVFDRNWRVVALHQGTLPSKNTNVGIRMDVLIKAIKEVFELKPIS